MKINNQHIAYTVKDLNKYLLNLVNRNKNKINLILSIYENNNVGRYNVQEIQRIKIKGINHQN
jgi:hypothetical protein